MSSLESTCRVGEEAKSLVRGDYVVWDFGPLGLVAKG